MTSLLETAKRNCEVADHMASVTFTLFNDPKILLAIIENLFLAIASSMTAVLHHEKDMKRIPPFDEHFAAKLKVFSEVHEKLGFASRHVGLAEDLQCVIQAHKESPVEFIRKDRFVICNDDYDMKTLTIERLKQYVIWTKEFVDKSIEAVNK